MMVLALQKQTNLSLNIGYLNSICEGILSPSTNFHMETAWILWICIYIKRMILLVRENLIFLFFKRNVINMYIPAKSGHAKHTIRNFILSELKRYVRYNTVKLGFFRIRNKFYGRLRNRGYKKVQLTRLFR